MRTRIPCLLAFAALACSALAAEVRVLAPNAARASVAEAVSAFEKATGHTVVLAWSGTEAITRRIAEGEVVDVAVNAAQNIERQSKDGLLVAATRTDFARSGIGVAAPAAAVPVDVATADALKSALLSARSIVVSSGTSGRHMLEAFVKLGLGEQLKAKTQQSPSGAQVADILAKGEADIGFQQISELLHAPGIRYLGPVPADLQNYTIYAAALHARAPNAEAAKALLSTLRAPATQALIRASGMEPL